MIMTTNTHLLAV